MYTIGELKEPDLSLSDLSAKLKTLPFDFSALDQPFHFLAGTWVKAGGGTTKVSANPSTGAALMKIVPDKKIMQQAIDKAAKSYGQIAKLDMAKRLDILARFHSMLADYQQVCENCLRAEIGKPSWEAKQDISAALRHIRYVVENGTKVIDTLLAPAGLSLNKGEYTLKPLGVSAGYLPFSTPIESFALIFSGCVLAGSPLVLSSSVHVSLTTFLLTKICEQINLPEGMLSVIFGGFSDMKTAINDKRVSSVLYIGSREHCDFIRRESKSRVGRQLVLQSGGKNAAIIHSSADLDLAVKTVTFGALKTAGQRCSSTSRVFVYRSLADEFKERLKAAFNNIPIGRTDNPGVETDNVFLGPLYSAKAVEKYLRFQTMANREAKDTLLWGKALESDNSGYFVTPSIHYLDQFDNGSAYQGNVLFSPNVAIYEYDVLDEAIDKINTTDAALSVSFIGDPHIITKRKHQFLAPNLLVNLPTVENEVTLPLAGRLQSGHHRFFGAAVALYLCYPQVLCQNQDLVEEIRQWPWPKSEE
jgi:acyl-CoA reductase-like NAD-dependent aldehyde dehydrogenase